MLVPSPWLEELEPVAMAEGRRRGRVCGGSGGRRCFPSARANPRSDGYVGEGRRRTVNLVRRAGRPPPFI